MTNLETGVSLAAYLLGGGLVAALGVFLMTVAARRWA